MTAENKPQILVATVTPDLALEVWSQAEPIIARALEHDYDDMTTNQILSRILRGDITLLIILSDGEIIACMTLEYVRRVDRICHCMTFCGDDMFSWVESFMDAWRQIASETGCKYISIKGRKGWERYAKRFGFQHAYTQMYLNIEEAENVGQ